MVVLFAESQESKKKNMVMALMLGHARMLSACICHYQDIRYLPSSQIMSAAFTDITDAVTVSMVASELVERMTVTLASSRRESNSDNTHPYSCQTG